MRMVDIIGKKRDGERLSEAEIRFFISQYTAGAIPDYQASALADGDLLARHGAGRDCRLDHRHGGIRRHAGSLRHRRVCRGQAFFGWHRRQDQPGGSAAGGGF